MAEEPTEQTEPTIAETFAFKDPVTQQEVQLPKNLEPLIGHIISKTRNDVKSQYKKDLEALSSSVSAESKAKAELEARLQAIEDEKLTVEEKIKKDLQRKEDEWSKKITEESNKAQQFQNLFQDTKISNDLLSAMSGYELNNQKQAMQLLRMEGQAKTIPQEDGSYKTVLVLPNEHGEPVEMSPTEAVQRYFAMPENMHHLKKNIQAGSGSSQRGGIDSSGNMVFKAEAIRNDPKVRAEYSKLLMAGEKVAIKD